MATLDMFKYEKNVAYYDAGEALFKTGETGHHMYVVQQGELEVISNGEVIDRIGPGGVVGEMALVDNALRSADVIARTDSVVVPIDENAFMQHVHRTPFFALQVMRIMAERLRRHMAAHHPAG